MMSLLLFSCVQHFEIPGTAPPQALLSSTISWRLLKFMSIELGGSHPLSSPSPFAFNFPQHQSLFQ